MLALRIALVLAMLGTVCFIFVNSMLPKQESSEQSSKVEDFLEEVIPDDLPAKQPIIDNTRKIAHFTEYGLLGIEVALYVVIFMRKRLIWAVPASFGIPFAVGFLDESIQVLSDRGPAIEDVWIDIGGYAAFAVLTYGVCALCMLVQTALRKRRMKKDGVVTESDG